ncbi:hypothetical protein MPC4_110017 [Methylocella tundrae]|uniref:Uncharacterized protein n=1 Tax=Methylocella tundrae TaxID=227605 RepID=A0A8B6M109_METTU|nr:hypothetical protein MPC4_110017 [Methylocella tundrae]
MSNTIDHLIGAVESVAPTSNWRSTSIEIRRSRLASERPPKKGVETKNAFRSGELTAIGLIYFRSRDLKPSYHLRLVARHAIHGTLAYPDLDMSGPIKSLNVSNACACRPV